jgi:hypothetical protein
MDNVERGLCDDLDDAGRRRLWILQVVIERLIKDNPALVLELAFRFERFIQWGAFDAAAGPEPQPQLKTVSEPAEPASVIAKGQAPAEPARSSRLRGPLLQDGTREAFAAAAATGADNRELASLFQLTVRQAHAIRLSMARQRPEVRPRANSGATRSEKSGTAISHKEELAL